MKNLAHQLKKIGITLLCFIGGLVLVWVAQFVDGSGGLTMVLLIADVLICSIAILYFIFHIIVPPAVLNESITSFQNERDRQLFGAGSYPPATSTSITGNVSTSGGGRYDKLILGISFLFFLGLLAVARRQINISGHRAISDAIGPWFWWPLLGVGLMLLGGSERVIYKDQYGRLWEGQTGGGAGSVSALLGFLLSFILVYFSLTVNAYWFHMENFPANPNWITWIIAIVAFFFFGIAFTFLFKARSRKSHILLYVVMGMVLLLSRM